MFLDSEKTIMVTSEKYNQLSLPHIFEVRGSGRSHGAGGECACVDGLYPHVLMLIDAHGMGLMILIQLVMPRRGNRGQ